MDWGLQNRLARIIRQPHNRALMLAVDHGYFLGPTERLEDPGAVIAPLLRHCDSLMLTRGVLRTSVPAATGTPMVLRVSGGPSIIGEDLSREDITVSISDAIRLNASALAMSVFVGSKYEHQTVTNLGRLVGRAERYGIPVLAVTAVGKDLGKDARYLSLACRMAAEQGAHIVKTYYCDGFERVVRSCPVPIIVAGGKKVPEREALRLTYNSIRGGAVGVDMGRNIWQSDHPVAMIRAVRSVVYGYSDADQAYEFYQKLARGDPGNGAQGAAASGAGRAPSRNSSAEADRARTSNTATKARKTANQNRASSSRRPSDRAQDRPPNAGRDAKPPNAGRDAKPPNAGRDAKPPNAGRDAKPPNAAGAQDKDKAKNRSADTSRDTPKPSDAAGAQDKPPAAGDKPHG